MTVALIVIPGVAASRAVNSTNTRLSSSLWFPCLMALITDSRTATLTQWRASSSRPARRPMWSLTTWTKSSMSNALRKSRRTVVPLVIGSQDYK